MHMKKINIQIQLNIQYRVNGGILTYIDVVKAYLRLWIDVRVLKCDILDVYPLISRYVKNVTTINTFVTYLGDLDLSKIYSSCLIHIVNNILVLVPLLAYTIND